MVVFDCHIRIPNENTLSQCLDNLTLYEVYLKTHHHFDFGGYKYLKITNDNCFNNIKEFLNGKNSEAVARRCFRLPAT